MILGIATAASTPRIKTTIINSTSVNALYLYLNMTDIRCTVPTSTISIQIPAAIDHKPSYRPFEETTVPHYGSIGYL